MHKTIKLKRITWWISVLNITDWKAAIGLDVQIILCVLLERVKRVYLNRSNQIPWVDGHVETEIFSRYFLYQNFYLFFGDFYTFFRTKKYLYKKK